MEPFLLLPSCFAILLWPLLGADAHFGDFLCSDSPQSDSPQILPCAGAALQLVIVFHTGAYEAKDMPLSRPATF